MACGNGRQQKTHSHMRGTASRGFKQLSPFGIIVMKVVHIDSRFFILGWFHWRQVYTIDERLFKL